MITRIQGDEIKPMMALQLRESKEARKSLG